jgi:hypothetical protein
MDNKKLQPTDIEELDARLLRVRRILFDGGPTEMKDHTKGMTAKIAEIQNDTKHGGDFEILYFQVTHVERKMDGIMGALMRHFGEEKPSADETHVLTVEMLAVKHCRNCGKKHFVEIPLFYSEFEGADSEEASFMAATEIHQTLNG